MKLPFSDFTRRLLLVASLLFSVTLGLSLALGTARPAFAGDPIEPAAAVASSLTAQNYEVQEVTGPDTDPDTSADTATVIMPIVSDQLDAQVSAQLQSGWVALGAYYKDVANLRVGLLYQQRYILVYNIANSDWQDWLAGRLPSEDFWSHVQTAIFDSTTNQYLSSDSDFINKNFSGSNLPQPSPAGAPGEPSSVLLDVSSLLVPVGDSAGATVLARLSDEQGRRVPGQTITFTVSARNSGAFDVKTAQTDSEGVARATFKPSASLQTGDGGAPVSVLVAGPAKISNKLKLLVDEFDPTNTDAAKQATNAALENAGYKVDSFLLYNQTGPTGDVYIYGGPVMEAKSSQIDAAFFQQAKAGIGTTLAAFPQMTQVFVTQLVTIGKQYYWVQFTTVRSNWNSWLNGDKTEQQFWAGVETSTYDKNFQPIDEKTFIDKDFGTGEDVTPQTSDTQVSYTAKLTQEDWGPQQYYGEFSLPTAATMDGFSAQLKDGAKSWRLFELSNLHKPVFDSATDDLSTLQIGPGHYFLMVIADNPPASVVLRGTMRVRY